MAQSPVTTQPADKRNKNFQEVSLGYPKKIALQEASRCVQCQDPVCTRACPLGIDVRSFIRFLREGNVSGANEKIRQQSGFPSICGRICSAPCEASCVLTEEGAPIGIRALERYACEVGRSQPVKRTILRRGKKIAIVGSGPSGLAASFDLALKGFDVTIFEALDKPGGVLRYGIPEFRIPRKVLDGEIHDLLALGIVIKTNFFIGYTRSLDELKNEGFHAILLTMGAGAPKFMDLTGADLGGVYYGEEFLMRVNLIKPALFLNYKPNFILGNKVVVIGSGNTALDSARAALRLGKEVTLSFRRTEEEMRVRRDERELAKEEGIHFEPLVKPIEILGDGHHFVCGVKCVRMDYADGEKEGSWELIPVPDSEFIMEADSVIIAIGHEPNSLLGRFVPHLKLNRDGTIWIEEETGMTSIPGIFAAGNVVTNAGPVVEALASGKKAAVMIDRFINSQTPKTNDQKITNRPITQ